MKERIGKGRFISGVSLLTLSAVAVKVIGLLYRIPMLDALGTEGMGYFNTAYELYALFCVISTAGLPVAMSVLIARTDATEAGERQRARIFRVSLVSFVVLGVVGSGLLAGLSRPLATALGNQPAARSVAMIAPTVFFICLSGAFRGYFQGRRNMAPTAVSQVIEALGKLLLGLAFAALARARGADLPTTAAYAVSGLTAGTAISVGYLAIRYRLACRQPTAGLLTDRGLSVFSVASADGDEYTGRRILRDLLITAVPVTVSAGVISLTKCIDLGLILRRLQDTGVNAATANALYGCYSTLAVPVFNILPSLTTSVALPVVPALSAALGRMAVAGGSRKGTAPGGTPAGDATSGDATSGNVVSPDASVLAAARDEVRRTSASALRMTAWLSIPAGLGICAFAGGILSLLFSGQPEAVASATPWLRVLGLSVPTACLITVTGAMLQAAGHATRPVISMLVGTGIKTVLAYILLGIPSVGLMGAPISSLVCDAVIFAVNAGFIARICPDMIPAPRQAAEIFLLPLAVALPAFGVTLCLRSHLGWTDTTPVHTLGVILCVVCLYGVGMLFPLIRHTTLFRKDKT